MLQDLKPLYGIALGATDGVIGHVKDFYFDDSSWKVRYLVADTGTWLAERQVLLSPHAFGSKAAVVFAGDDKALLVNLTRKQIEDSPSIDSHRPVSRQHEEEYFRYYGWAGYWQDGGLWDGAGIAVAPPPPLPAAPSHHGHNQRDDVHLRSTKAVTGYRIHATDGEIGTVHSFLVDGKTWTIRELTVQTGHWYAGKTIQLLTKNITRIGNDNSSVFVNLSRKDITETLRNDVAQAGAGAR
ncbi:MAG: PRC-barrel domain-containing protein [bacterium]|nr:PRC-barrel domain-containing protein [bacterium]MDI1337879.1 PRC-barrel domain-containing protein [Lacunisphaera sp.]